MFGQVLRSSIKPLPMRLLSREFSTIQNIKHQKIEVPAYKYINNQINMRMSPMQKSMENLTTDMKEFRQEMKKDMENFKKDIFPQMLRTCAFVIMGSISIVELVSFVLAQNGYDFRVIYWNYGKPKISSDSVGKT